LPKVLLIRREFFCSATWLRSVRVREAVHYCFKNGKPSDKQACFSAEREHGGGVHDGRRRTCRLCEEVGWGIDLAGDDGAGECTGVGLLSASGEGIG
jgi:hypothetical protein